ncbi:MAG: hypothetical protein WD355_10360 [Balneolaceae bacterium]
MYRQISIPILFLLLICSCSGDPERDWELFDYSSLEEISYDVTLEFGESEGFIPANLAGLVVFPDGTLLVRDQSQTMIVQYNSLGEFVGVVAKEGGGPGELPGSFSMTVSGTDTLVVLHSGGRKDFYGRSSSGLFTHSRGVIAEQGEYSTTIVGVRSASEYYVRLTDPGIFSNLISAYTPYRHDYLAITDERNRVLVDSLHPIKIRNPLINVTTHSDGSIESLSVLSDIPYRYEDHFVPLEDGLYMIASNDSSAFYIYNETHELQQKIPLNARPRQVESSDLEDISRELRPYITDEKPPFITVWSADEMILLHTETYEENKEIILLSFEGEPLGKIMLPDIDEIHHFQGNRFYTVHKDEELGHSIRVYEL